MPKLSELVDTDYLPAAEPIPADIPRVYIGNGNAPVEQPLEMPSPASSKINSIINSLFRDDDKRYQLWPEKVIREGLSGAHDVMEHGTNLGLRREDVTDIPKPDMPTKDSTWLGQKLGIAPVAASPQDSTIEKAQAISALAGTGGLGGVTDATLGATPFLRPALKYKDKLYKGKEGQQHQDVIPDALYPEFNKMAMSGEDIRHYNFGFVNDKGHFLNREDALKYGIDTGLIDPQAGKFGALTSTLMADSSKPGTAIEAMAKTKMIKGTPKDHDGNPISDYNGKPINITEDGKLVLYHRTNEQSKNDIYNTGKFKSKENTNETFFSDNLDSEYGKGFGDHVVAVKIDPKYVRLNDQFPSGENHYAVSNKFLSKGNILKADSSKESAALQSIKEPFYSALEHNVSKISQNKMTGDQWLGTLSNKPGVKPEEMQWTGLGEFLKENGNKPVTKAQIEEHLAGNKVELKEVSKGYVNEPPAVAKMRDEFQKLSDKADDIEKKGGQLDQSEYNRIHELSAELSKHPNPWLNKNVDTKYHSYQLPGASNYREMLLTLPDKNPLVKLNAEYKALSDEFLKTKSLSPEKQARWAQVEEEITKLRKEGVDTDAGKYRSSHWDEPNILAHVRMNDRTMSEPGYRITNLKSGNTSKAFPTYEEALTYVNSLPENLKKNIQINEGISPKKSLHLEEIQSDWHQQGRDRGYKSEAEVKKYDDLMKDKYKAADKLNALQIQIKDELAKTKGFENLTNAQKTEKFNDAILNHKEYQENLKSFKTSSAEIEKSNPNLGVPDAPFKKSWHELALKRMIREAAEVSHKSEVASWEKMVHSDTDTLAHKLVASGHLKEICD